MEREEKKKRLKKSTLIAIIVLAVVVLFVIGFFVIKGLSGSNNSDNKEEEKKIEPTITPSTAPSTGEIKIIDLNSNTRPYAIMINCKSEALPQAGLQDAYLVYEEMVEGGITRMMALFKDKNLTKVGSIRSARVQYLPYVFENDAIYVHAGGSVEADNRMANEKINHIDADGQYGQRDMELAKKRAWEHTLFTNSKLLNKAASNYGYRTTSTQKPVLNYQAEEVDLSKYKTEDANKVSIKYSYYRTSNYAYDKESKTYLRSMNNAKNIDLVTNEQYKVKNIIIYGVKYNTVNLRGAGYQDPQIYGKGDGYYVTDGVALPITWEKKDEKSQTVYKIKETGDELVVNDGNTYIQIYPTNGGKLTIE